MTAFMDSYMTRHCGSVSSKKEINEASSRIRGPEAFLRFWDRVLTDVEKEQLGGDVEDWLG